MFLFFLCEGQTSTEQTPHDSIWDSKTSYKVTDHKRHRCQFYEITMWFFFSTVFSFNEINKLWGKWKVMAFLFFFKWICLPSSKIQGLSKLTFFRTFWVLLCKSWQGLTLICDWEHVHRLLWNCHFLQLQTRNGGISPSNRHLTPSAEGMRSS